MGCDQTFMKYNKGGIVMKKYTFIFAAVFAVLWTMQVQAAFQWNADVQQSFTWRRGYDLNADDNNPVGTRGDISANTAGETFGIHSGEAEDFFTTLLGINGTWTLVKDTSFSFRVASQFDWLGAQTVGPAQTATPGRESGTVDTHAISSLTPFGLSVNQAYLTLADFAGFPITFKAGRQNVWLGKGFVLGNRLFGAGPTIYANGMAPSGSNSDDSSALSGKNGQDITATMGNLPLNAISGGSLNSPESADFTGFDGVLANIHLLDNKFNFDLGYFLVSTALTESQPSLGERVIRNLGTADNETLFVMNAGYKTKTWNTEGYFLFNHDREPANDMQRQVTFGQSSDRIYTYGLRGDVDWQNIWKIKKMNTFAEASLQRGLLGAYHREANARRHRNAQAWNFGFDTWWDAMWSPTLGFEAAWFSGMNPQSMELNDNNTPEVGSSEVWTVWDPQFRGRYFTKIMDFLDSVYLTDVLNILTVAADGTTRGRLDAGFTNRMVLALKNSFSPLKKTNIGWQLAWAQAVQPPQPGRVKDLGFEIDWDVTYDISNVTKWYLDGGVFFPGDYYDLMPKIGAVAKPADAINAVLLRTGFKINLG